MSFNDDKKEIQERVIDLIDKTNDKFGLGMAYPTITYDLKGTVAGQAFYYENKLRLNSIALKKYREHFIEQTVGHEVAHLTAFKRHGGGISPHGTEWKNFMRFFHLPPDRCHTYDLPSARGGSRKRYVCQSCPKEFSLSAIKHNRWLRGENKLSCQRCGGKVVWENTVPQKKKPSEVGMDLIEF